MMIVAAIAYGAIAALVFRYTTDSRRLRQTTNQILARIMEFHLFVDEPALIWRAQLGALKANFALLRQVAIPGLIMGVLFAILYPTMDGRFGYGPLRAGEATVITAANDSLPPIDGIVVETPGVRIARTGETSWRIRLVSDAIGHIPAGVGIRYPRTGGWMLWFFAISCVSAVVFAKAVRDAPPASVGEVFEFRPRRQV